VLAAGGLVVLSVLAGSGCGPAAVSKTDVQATVLAVVQATLTAQPTPTPGATSTQVPAPKPTAVATPAGLRDDEIAAHGRSWTAHIERGNTIGSGVVVSPDGYILTNQHVVNEDGRIRVRLSDGRTLFGELVGEDLVVDLALIKVRADGLSAATLSDPSTLQQGDPLVAVGFALDLPGEPSITRGVFSGRRSLDGSLNYIQTDAALNPGMSGGAMLDRTGGLVGINVATIDRVGGRSVQGISFAIPSDLADSFVASARSGQLGAVAARPVQPTTQASIRSTSTMVVNKRYGAALRAAPSSDAAIITALSCGAPVQVLSGQDPSGWFLVRADSSQGWVGGVRLREGAAADPASCVGAPYPPYALGQNVRALVQSGCLGVRTSPSANAAITGCVTSGHNFQITNGPIEVDLEDWFAVRSTSTGLSGWTRAQYLTR
jgi:S1-C subfamily serine protease